MVWDHERHILRISWSRANIHHKGVGIFGQTLGMITVLHSLQNKLAVQSCLSFFFATTAQVSFRSLPTDNTRYSNHRLSQGDRLHNQTILPWS